MRETGADKTQRRFDRFGEELLTTLARRAADAGRYLLGVTGCPGSGKSTFARQLVEAIDRRCDAGSAVAVAMDGFHYCNTKLDALGLRAVKGGPGTFDVPAFVDLLARLRQSPPVAVMVPVYDRQRHDPIADAVRIDPAATLVVVEGNYLLLDTPPWDAVRPWLDAIWSLDTPIEVAMQRTRRRHLAGGSSEEQADERIRRNDFPNAQLVAATLKRADRVVHF